MSTAVVRELDYLREHGGRGQIKPEDKPGPGYKALGILYGKTLSEDQVELKVLYAPHIPINLRDAIAERFGTGAKEWAVTEKT